MKGRVTKKPIYKSSMDHWVGEEAGTCSFRDAHSRRRRSARRRLLPFHIVAFIWSRSQRAKKLDVASCRGGGVPRSERRRIVSVIVLHDCRGPKRTSLNERHIKGAHSPERCSSVHGKRTNFIAGARANRGTAPTRPPRLNRPAAPRTKFPSWRRNEASLKPWARGAAINRSLYARVWSEIITTAIVWQWR